MLRRERQGAVVENTMKALLPWAIMRVRGSPGACLHAFHVGEVPHRSVDGPGRFWIQGFLQDQNYVVFNERQP